MKSDIHFCLVSKQATPNLAPVLAAEFRPKKVFLYVSNEMKKAADNLARVIKKYGIACEQIAAIDAYDISAIQNQLLTFLDTQSDQSIALNVTGGTKPMAIAAQEAFRMAGKSVFYVNPESNDILFLDAQTTPLSLTSKIRLDDYLGAHGYEVKGDVIRSLPQSEARNFLTSELIGHINVFSDAIGTINYYASKAKNTLEVTVNHPKIDKNWKQVVDMFEDAGILKLRDDKLCFADADSRAYANGGWLEEHVFGIVKQLQLQDLAINMEVTNESGIGHATNELDIAFLARNKLHLIECKAKIFRDDDKSGADALYKLDSLAALGGLNTKCMLLSYRQLRNADKQRAKDLRIKTIEGEHLCNLRNQLQSWIGS
ncbi:MAG: DUF1887 family protein [Oxalobacteraceae bacterium]|nr:DUF1887 family protein [Oxalobacteraceae bacterium]